jgi:hypothetical protein
MRIEQIGLDSTSRFDFEVLGMNLGLGIDYPDRISVFPESLREHATVASFQTVSSSSAIQS